MEGHTNPYIIHCLPDIMIGQSVTQSTPRGWALAREGGLVPAAKNGVLVWALPSL